MGIYEDELAGGEFDWFAIDSHGNIALFSTAGEGIIPPKVIDAYKQHNKISEGIATPNWGSSDIWQDYANVGLFVFDWSLHGGPYIKEKSPCVVMCSDLKNKILSITNLKKLDMNFSVIEKIEL